MTEKLSRQNFSIVRNANRPPKDEGKLKTAQNFGFLGWVLQTRRDSSSTLATSDGQDPWKYLQCHHEGGFPVKWGPREINEELMGPSAMCFRWRHAEPLHPMLMSTVSVTSGNSCHVPVRSVVGMEIYQHLGMKGSITLTKQ